MANKVGDIALLISCATMQLLYKSFDFATIFASVDSLLLQHYHMNAVAFFRDQILVFLDNEFTDYVFCASAYSEMLSFFSTFKGTGYDLLLFYEFNSVICFFIIVASIGKSAQAGLHM
jgi:hypothetical protein